MPEQFHFLQPLWLLSLVPLALLVWRLRQVETCDNPWARVIDARLRPLLLSGQDNKASRTLLWLLSMGWLLAALALANPVWEKQPQPLYQTSTARVIVLDLSLSMLDRDIKPSRLARARFKIEDILARSEEGQTGLVVFAGDTFTVTPLTRDGDTILALLKSLEPSLMPVQGSRPDLGLIKAGELLKQAGLSDGQVLLFADGVFGNKAQQAAAQLRKQGYRVSVLGIGSENAEPLTNTQGQLLHTTDGKLIIPQLETKALQAVAEAGGGNYRTFDNSDTDITSLLDDAGRTSTETLVKDELQTQDWKDRGPWLVLLLLPMAALAFRRGWLLSLMMLVGVNSIPQPAMAADWNDLWQRTDQQVAKAFSKKDYQLASQLAKDPLQRGSAMYKSNDYAQALEDFSQANGATADYNRGNTLAKLGRYEDAISAYDTALNSSPDMEDALANKAAVEALLRQQKEQNKNQQGQQGKQDEQGQSGEQGQKDQQNQQGQSGEQGQKDQQNQQGQSGEQGQKDQQNQQSQSGEQGQKDQQNQQGQSGEQGQKDETQKNEGNSETNQFADAANALKEKGSGEESAANEQTDQDQSSKRNEDAGKSMAQQQQSETGREGDGPPASAELLSSEEQMAAEQWLRRIPDDPGGLLRRKFLYQYQQQPQPEGTGSPQPW